MKKALFFRWFGAGKFPAVYATNLTGEGILLSDEGLKASVTYRNFHRPGSSSGYRKTGNIGSVIVTEMRIAAYFGEDPVIDVPFADDRLKQVAFSVEPNGALLAAFDASLFHNDWTGQVAYRFHTPLAQAIVDQIRAQVS